MKQKVVLITGGAGRLGVHLVGSLLSNGHTVIACDSNNASLERFNKKFSAKIKEGRVISLKMDITSESSIKKALRSALARFKKVDVLINNAYPRNKNYGRKFEKVNYADFVDNVGKHAGGYFLCSRILSEYFSRQKGGSIINMASIYGFAAPRFEIYKGTSMTMPVEYAVIKAGIIQLTRYMAKYLKGRNIRVNAVSPGGILMNESPKFVKRYSAYSTTHKMLSPDAVCSSVLFLVSDDSRSINGQNLIVDEGWTL